MIFYKVKALGDGSEGNPFRPDIPVNVAFVWSDSVCDTCGTYILATTVVEGLEIIADIPTACESRNLNVEDVEKWFVGD